MSNEEFDALDSDEILSLKLLARRKYDMDGSEKRMLDRISNRAALAKQMWAAIVAFVSAIVWITMRVVQLNGSIESNAREIQLVKDTDIRMMALIERNYELYWQLREVVGGKQNKP